mmetsp:Transcript_14229/g.38678  ORF Transcript_14229/g.38678 Transcript_14229/m.38678 type:complete len:456 (-) Transcript_14229:874-2241(-)
MRTEGEHSTAHRQPHKKLGNAAEENETLRRLSRVRRGKSTSVGLVWVRLKEKPFELLQRDAPIGRRHGVEGVDHRLQVWLVETEGVCHEKQIVNSNMRVLRVRLEHVEDAADAVRNQETELIQVQSFVLVRIGRQDCLCCGHVRVEAQALQTKKKLCGVDRLVAVDIDDVKKRHQRPGPHLGSPGVLSLRWPLPPLPRHAALLRGLVVPEVEDVTRTDVAEDHLQGGCVRHLFKETLHWSLVPRRGVPDPRDLLDEANHARDDLEIGTSLPITKKLRVDTGKLPEGQLLLQQEVELTLELRLCGLDGPIQLQEVMLAPIPQLHLGYLRRVCHRAPQFSTEQHLRVQRLLFEEPQVAMHGGHLRLDIDSVFVLEDFEGVREFVLQGLDERLGLFLRIPRPQIHEVLREYLAEFHTANLPLQVSSEVDQLEGAALVHRSLPLVHVGRYLKHCVQESL